jgi:hypothetical protein
MAGISYDDYHFLDTAEEVEFLRHLLCDVIEQNCERSDTEGSGTGEVDAGFIRSHEVDAGSIRSHAEAIRYLYAHEFLKDIRDSGREFRGVSASIRPEENRGKDFV